MDARVTWVLPGVPLGLRGGGCRTRNRRLAFRPPADSQCKARTREGAPAVRRRARICWYFDVSPRQRRRIPDSGSNSAVPRLGTRHVFVARADP